MKRGWFFDQGAWYLIPLYGLLIGLSVSLLVGCSLSPSADVINALAKDQASVCIKLTSIYENFLYSRTNLINQGTMKCSTDGLEVKSDGAQVGVPVQVIPQVTIGQPTVTTPTTPAR